MTYKKHIPSLVKRRWLDYNPSYTVDFSLDRDCMFFLMRHFNSHVYRRFKTINQGMYKADLWRLCKLYKHSGVYADVDIVPYLDIDTLDKDITFHSCLSIGKGSIFQAFMVNFSRPNNPLFLVFLISFLINRPYTYSNGPTYDMYNCITYMLDVDVLEVDKKYEVEVVKLRIRVGPSKHVMKSIPLYYFPDNIDYTIQLHKHKYGDRFKFRIDNNTLFVTRTDKRRGWGHNHHVDICFASKTSFLFFKEQSKQPGRYRNAFVSHRGEKIMDSRDKNYTRKRGFS